MALKGISTEILLNVGAAPLLNFAYRSLKGMLKSNLGIPKASRISMRRLNPSITISGRSTMLTLALIFFRKGLLKTVLLKSTVAVSLPISTLNCVSKSNAKFGLKKISGFSSNSTSILESLSRSLASNSSSSEYGVVTSKNSPSIILGSVFLIPTSSS